MNEKLYCLIYVSTTSNDWNDTELKKLLIKARKHNEKNHITGGLVLSQNKFIQILEGEKKVVDELFHKITKDKKHHSILTLLSYEINHRFFNDWSMAFKRLDVNEFNEIYGYSEIEKFIESITSVDVNSPASFFLKMFYQRNVEGGISEIDLGSF